MNRTAGYIGHPHRNAAPVAFRFAHRHHWFQFSNMIAGFLRDHEFLPPPAWISQVQNICTRYYLLRSLLHVNRVLSLGQRLNLRAEPS